MHLILTDAENQFPVIGIDYGYLREVPEGVVDDAEEENDPNTNGESENRTDQTRSLITRLTQSCVEEIVKIAGYLATPCKQKVWRPMA